MWATLDPEIIESRIKIIEKYKAEKSTVKQVEFCAKNNITVTQLRDWQCQYNKQVKRFVPVTIVENSSKPEADDDSADEHCVLEYGEMRIRFLSKESLIQIPEILAVMKRTDV